jgi:hypothetical protein
MADGPGQAVNYRLLIFMDMAVGMGNAVGMLIGVVVVMVTHNIALLSYFSLLYRFSPHFASPYGG